MEEGILKVSTVGNGTLKDVSWIHDCGSDGESGSEQKNVTNTHHVSILDLRWKDGK